VLLKLPDHDPGILNIQDRKDVLNIRDREGMSPVHLAACNGHDKAVILLLGNKANFEASDNHGQDTAMVRREEWTF
jgi:ankyrin repeat protein